MRTKQAKQGNGKPASEMCERERNALVFLATLVATVVLGFTPDLAGLASWFLAWGRLASGGIPNELIKHE
ncbi:MAG: hypothetical protein ACRD2B_17275 [Terriglobia bacterium]